MTIYAVASCDRLVMFWAVQGKLIIKTDLVKINGLKQGGKCTGYNIAYWDIPDIYALILRCCVLLDTMHIRISGKSPPCCVITQLYKITAQYMTYIWSKICSIFCIVCCIYSFISLTFLHADYSIKHLILDNSVSYKFCRIFPHFSCCMKG